MADVTINYEGNAIATMSASGTKTLLTEGKYCTDDIEVVYVAPGGGSSIYQTQYTLVGDTTFADFLTAVNYSVHSLSCIVIVRSNGTAAPTTGSYTLNNFTVLISNGSIQESRRYFQSGKHAPNVTPVNLLQNNEDDTTISLNGYVLQSSYTGSSCMGTTGAVVSVNEITVPDTFRSVACSTTII